RNFNVIGKIEPTKPPISKNVVEVSTTASVPKNPVSIPTVTTTGESKSPVIKDSTTNITSDKKTEMASVNPKQSIFGFMVAAFLAGLAALLTPCVFPIIPMTVTFFTRKSGNRSKAIGQALLYGFSIVFIYTLIGTIVAKVAGPDAAHFLSTHWFPNVFFFVVFVIFGVSFLGMFDIVLPSWLVNKVDAESEKGGIYGIFFMAFTLVLVSFSCTGPIVGTILVESAGGQFLKPIAGMFSFSFALALPFTLFAIFPNWLSSLPKSGGWLNTVKVTLGFLELALALKFISIADQVYHWRLLDREIYLALWIAIFSVLGIYLLGKIRLPHDDETTSISVPRTIFAVLVFSFVVYLVPGMFGAPLKALSGYLPPQTTHSFDLSNAAGSNNSTSEISGNI
ncbi:MAG: disulfide bond formation protein DsbD, partial [Cytophagales bacterium]|nr:disulfide bond formation protein DsbD [Cytophagales bacterium]